MSNWEPVIGLEIHVQLATNTKMFCGCELTFGQQPNTRTCPVCLGLPGSLPVVNKRAVELGIRMGLAFDCDIAERSIFARKNYFYPDNPKGYQISQNDLPICLGGSLGDIRLHRIHLEEDAAKLVHVSSSGRIDNSDASIVDFNRAGTPLAEIVTEPDIRSAEQARDWLGLLRETLRQLDVSDVNMEEGSLRCDANVSVRPVGSTELRTKTELKNMNSFRYLMQGVNVEIARQIAEYEAGREISPQTLHFDPSSGTLRALRSKEAAHDYRYFPEPDLGPLVVTESMVSTARTELPELPEQLIARYVNQWELPVEVARIFAYERSYGHYFEAAVGSAATKSNRSISNWILDLRSRIDSDDPSESKVKPAAIAELATLAEAKTINMTIARELLDRLIAEGGSPIAIVENEGLSSAGLEDELRVIVRAAIEANADAAERIKSGNHKAIGPIVGQVMRETKGRADGGVVGQMILEQLGV